MEVSHDWAGRLGGCVWMFVRVWVCVVGGWIFGGCMTLKILGGWCVGAFGGGTGRMPVIGLGVLMWDFECVFVW